MSARRYTDEELIEAARALPVPECPPDRREQARLTLMLAMETRRDEPGVPRARGHRATSVVAAALVAAALFLVPATTRHRSDGARLAGFSYATIGPQPGARFERVSGPPDELIRLHEGTIAVEVSPLAPGHRFRILIGDDEVEVHGTAFTVAAVGNRLRTVAVREGVVEVRPRNRPAGRLGAGHRWLSPQAIIDEIPEPRDAPAVTPAPAREPAGPRRPRAPRPPAARDAEQSSAGEAAFADGWAALRKRDFDRAATCFARAREATAGSPMAEDASFWHAVALKRGGHREAARSALESFLRSHPTSDRAGEASVMLGWLLLEAGETDDAARHFQLALDDQIEPVRRGASAGMAAVRTAETRRRAPRGE